MTDPQRLDKDKPRRAEPLQPDRPGRGTDAESNRPSASGNDEHEKQLSEQTRNAHGNVREGYGGGSGG